MKKRDDLRLIVSSATLDAEVHTHSHTNTRTHIHSHTHLRRQLFKNFFETNSTGDRLKDTAVILTVEGRVFGVQPFYVKRSVLLHT